MLDLIASGLTESSRETLSVAAGILVALTLGVLIQGRIVDEHVDPPANVRAYLVAIEIVVSGTFFIPAAGGVYICLYYLAADRVPEGADRAIIENALLTTALLAFVLTIARRALPAVWPPGGDRGQPWTLSWTRAGVMISIGLVIASAAAAVTLETGALIVFVALLAIAVVVFMMVGSRLERHLGTDEGLLGVWLGRGAWTRVPTRPLPEGLLDGATDLPNAFVPLSRDPADTRLWLSNAGLQRIGVLLRDRNAGETGEDTLLRWHGRRRAELLSPGDAGSGGPVQVAHVVILHRNDARLFLVEPGLQLIERDSGADR